MDSQVLPAQVEHWIREMHHHASGQPGTGACAVATAMELWLWTFQHVLNTTHQDDPSSEPGDLQLLTDAFCRLLSARSMVLGSWDKVSVEEGAEGAASPFGAQEGLDDVYVDLCHAQTARAAGEVGRICAELVFGRRRHPTWDHSCNACIQAEEIDTLEGIMPGISYGARLTGNVMEADGSHAEKAGPCVSLEGLQGFIRLRTKLDGCLSGAQLARNRAAGWLGGLGLAN